MRFSNTQAKAKQATRDVTRSDLKPGDLFQYRTGKKTDMVYMAVSPDGVFNNDPSYQYGVNLTTGNISRAKAGSTTPVNVLITHGVIESITTQIPV